MALNELKLVLSVDGAGNVTGNLKDVEGAVDSLGKKTSSATDNINKAWRAAEEQINAMRKTSSVVTDRLAADFERLKIKSDYSLQHQKNTALAAYNSIKNSGVASATEIERAYSALKTTLAELNREMGNTTKSTADLNQGMKNTGKSAGMMAEAWKMLPAAAIGVALGAVVKESIQAALQMERLNKLFSAAAGNANLAGRELEYVRGVSNRLGLDLLSTADSYGKFLVNIRGTTLEGEKGRKVFEAVSGAASALGLTTETTNRAFTALNQMLGKGKVSAEELRQQWSEAIPGGFKMAADAMGMTTAELDKALEQGKVMSEDLLPKLADQLEKTYGKAALEGANSAQAAINRMNNAMLESKATLGSALMPVFTDFMTIVLTPVIKLLGDFVKMLQHAAATAAYLTAQTSDGFKGLLSGKVFSKEGYKQSMEDALENERIYKSQVDKIWAQPGAGAYSAADKLRQAQNKPTKPLADGKAKAAADALKKEEQEYEAYLHRKRKHDEEYLAYKNALADAALQHTGNIRKLELAQLDSLRGQDLISEAAYLANKAGLNAQAAEERVSTLKKKLSDAIDAERNAMLQLEKGPDGKLTGSKDEVTAYHKALTEQVKARSELEKAVNDKAVSGLHDQLAVQRHITSEVEKLKELQNELTNLQNSNAELQASMLNGNDQSIESVYQREMAMLEARYKSEFDLIDQSIAKHQELYDKQIKGSQKAANTLAKIDELERKKELKQQEQTLKGQKLTDDSFRSQLGMTAFYTNAAGQMFSALASAQDTSARSGFETAKAFNIAAAVMSTASGIMSAFAAPDNVTMVQKIVAAALVATTGAIQIATIASTSFGGTTGTVSMPSAGSFGGSGGGSSTVGTKIGVALQDPLQAASTDAMVQLAESAESASMAIGDLADVFERIAATFEEGIGASLVSRAKGLLVGTVLPTGYTTDTSRFNDKVFQDGINAIFNDALQALNAAAVGLGVAPQTSVTARSIEFGGNWDEDRIQKELEGYLQQAMDTFAKGFNGLEEYAKAGENASDALIRLSTALTAFNDVAELAGITLLEGLSGANMASKIADVMGGQDEMTEAIESYFGAVFTDAEQSVREAEKAQLDIQRAFDRINADALLQAKQNQQLYTETWIDLDATTKQLVRIPKTAQELAEELKNVGIQVPATREEFRSLVNSLDITTDSGASTFAALMKVSESFGTVMEAADEAAAKLREYQDLEVRLLNAQGNTAAADALERKLSAEREMQDAITSGMDAAYIARLKEVLALEEQVAASEASAAATSKAAEALTTATKAAESSVSSITSAFANLTKAQATADAQLGGAMVGGVQLSASEYKSYGSFVTFLDQAGAELQKIADMGFPEELQAAVDQITAMVDTASKQLAGQVASARILAGDAAGALAAYQKWTMPKDGFTNPDGSFNAGAFNSQYLRNQAAQALSLGAEASANALRVVNAMSTAAAFDYSGSNELRMYALWDLIDYFGNGFSDDVGKTITNNMRATLDAIADFSVETSYAPQGPGINEIRRAQIAQQQLTSVYTANGETYYGDQSVAYGMGLQTINRLMKDNKITADEYAESLERLENATGVTAETVINTYEEIQAAQLAAAQALKQAGLNSMNYYLGQISVMGRELLQTAIDTGTALGKVTESIGRMKSWSDVLTLSVNTAAELADLEANKGRADIARAIAAAAADAQNRLTTADAAAAQPVLQGMTAFAGMDTVKLRDISLLIDGLKQFDPTSFEQAFTRISAALVDGMITIDQYAALYSYSMQVYEGTAKDALASLEQTGSDALQILENAINKAKEAQQVIVDQLRTLSDSLHSLIEGLQTPTDETLINRQAAQAQLRELVASNTLPAPGEFDAAMRALSEPSKQLFGSFESYAEDFYKTAIDLSTLSTRTDSQLSIAEQEMQRLDGILQAAKDQWDELHGTKLAVMSVEEALVNFQNAVIALSQGQTPALAIAGLNSFAVGTNYVPYDMVAQIHQGERIIPRADNYRLMQGNDEMVAELKALREEVSQLRSEQRSQAAVVATNTDKTAKALTRVMPDGDALAVRIAA